MNDHYSNKTVCVGMVRNGNGTSAPKEAPARRVRSASVVCRKIKTTFTLSTEFEWNETSLRGRPSAVHGSNIHPSPDRQQREMLYRMNLPRKNPRKMAAMTTSSEGREPALDSRPRAELELLVTCSPRWTFLSLTPSSWHTHQTSLVNLVRPLTSTPQSVLQKTLLWF